MKTQILICVLVAYASLVTGAFAVTVYPVVEHFPELETRLELIGE